MRERKFLTGGLLLAVLLTVAGGAYCLANASSSVGEKRVKPGKAKTARIKSDNRAENGKSSFASPDFAFPQDVEKDARVELEKALQSGDDVQLIQAAIQIVIAKNSVSHDNAASMLSMLDSLASARPAPYSNVLYVAEARLLSDIFNADRWQYNQRNLPLDSYPEDVFAWSGDLFRQRIFGLMRKATADFSTLLQTPVKEIQPVLVKLRSGESYSPSTPSVGDFLADMASDLLGGFTQTSLIPFGPGGGKREVTDSIGGYLDSLDDECIDTHRAAGERQAEMTALLRKAGHQPEWEKTRALLGAIDTFSGDAASIRLVAPLFNMTRFNTSSSDRGKTDPERPEYLDNVAHSDILFDKGMFYRYATEEFRQYPDTVGSSETWTIINQLDSKTISLQASGRYTTADSVKVTVGLNNVADCYMILYRCKKRGDTQRKLSALLPNLEKVRAYPVSSGDSVPFSKEVRMNLGRLGYGEYVIVPSSTADASGISKETLDDYVNNLFDVSDMACVVTRGYYPQSSGRLYVTSAFNQEPVKGAVVTFSSDRYKKGEKISRVTGADGYVEIPKGNYNVEVKKGNDVCFTTTYLGGSGVVNNREKLNADVYTDLSIYKPGAKVGYCAIISSMNNRRSHIANGLKAEVKLYDANGNVVDTQNLVTDDFGRISGEFTLPESGLLGTYRIQVRSGDKASERLGSTTFAVAEYKAPTFEVTVDKVSGSYAVGDVIKITGRAQTYSGMAVAGADVIYNVRFTPRFFYYMGSNPDATYAGTATTDGEGVFTIELETEGLKDTPFCLGSYSLTAAVTDASGETRESAAVTFSLGSAYDISADVPESIVASPTPVEIAVTVYDMIHSEVKKSVDYTIKNLATGAVVASGSFETPKFSLATEELSSAKYRVEFSVAGDSKSDKHYDFIVWREGDDKVPYPTPLWAPKQQIVAGKGEKVVRVKAGSAYPDSYLLCMAYDCEKVLWQKWVKSDGKLIEIPVDVPADNDRITLVMSGMHSLEGVSETVSVLPYESTAGIELVKETFRDKIVPGDKEIWRFKFIPKGAQGKTQTGVLAVMSNKALNAIEPFEWMRPGISPYYPSVANMNIYGAGSRSSRFFLSRYKAIPVLAFPTPELNTYGCSLFDGYTRRVMYKLYGSRSASPEPMVAYDMVLSENTVASGSVEAVKEAKVEEADSVDEGGADVAKEPLRDIECPLAFFKPNLFTNADGVVELSFEVPDFNTTWVLQLLGYTPELKSALVRFESVASKLVMVQTNVPRFLRTGDTSMLRATVFNNTDAAAVVNAVMEIFDPLTDKVILSREFPELSIDAKGQQTIGLEMTASGDANCIGVRVYAKAGNHRDGEQAVVAILPSSSPVIESTPFYLGPDKNSYGVKLPNMQKDASVTLQYCDNPAWVCLTALPDITGKPDASITSKITALYGTAIANGLVAKMPQAADAIREWLANPEDSVLLSPLVKNEELKKVMLDETPWVQNAGSESLRMLRLGHLLETKRNDATISGLLKDILEMQKSDGGFAWCPGMESSEWATSRVLLYFGMLRGLGYLPDYGNLSRSIDRAVNYSDAKLLEYVRKCKNYPLAYATNYYYVRSFFDTDKSRAVEADLEKCLKGLLKSWKRLDIYDAATAAILLSRYGYTGDAKQILESLRQKASVSEGKGMWFANLRSGYGGFGKLITTTQALEAFAEIEPGCADIDRLRQWLILQKQAQEWGDNPYTAEIVNAVLTSGSDWTVSSAPSRFYLGGKELTVDKRSRLTGEFTLSLPATEASGAELRIEKNGSHPAWGGVDSRFIQPMNEVKAAKTEDISITKQIYTVSDTDSGTFVKDGNPQQGQRVRVTLTLTTTRDLDYVAITDERAACMEPANQLSGYTSTDGLFYYREVRDSATNLFIGFLPKGTWQLTYDCFIDRTGDFSCGIATAQSMYAPTIVAHSGGRMVKTYDTK